MVVGLATEVIDKSECSGGAVRFGYDRDGDFGSKDACQARAVQERAVADFGDAVGEGDARQARAVLERAVADFGDAVGDMDARQSLTTAECAVADFGDAVGNVDARQARECFLFYLTSQSTESSPLNRPTMCPLQCSRLQPIMWYSLPFPPGGATSWQKTGSGTNILS